MRIKVKKIKAFTLSEMIVVLLITTIVVGMSFAVLNLVQRQMNGIENNYEKNTELNLLRHSLWIDFNRYEKVLYEHKSGALTFTNDMETIDYIINENSIVKHRDTFQIDWANRKFYFDNSEVSFGEIDALKLETTAEFGNQKIFVFKNNSATTYMNR